MYLLIFDLCISVPSRLVFELGIWPCYLSHAGGDCRYLTLVLEIAIHSPYIPWQPLPKAGQYVIDVLAISHKPDTTTPDLLCRTGAVFPCVSHKHPLFLDWGVDIWFSLLYFPIASLTGNSHCWFWICKVGTPDLPPDLPNSHSTVKCSPRRICGHNPGSRGLPGTPCSWNTLLFLPPWMVMPSLWLT